MKLGLLADLLDLPSVSGFHFLVIAGDFNLVADECEMFPTSRQGYRLVAGSEPTFTISGAESNIDYFVIRENVAANIAKERVLDYAMLLHPHTAVRLELKRTRRSERVQVWVRPQRVKAVKHWFGPLLPEEDMAHEWADLQRTASEVRPLSADPQSCVRGAARYRQR
jgi:hypothetical protein